MSDPHTPGQRVRSTAPQPVALLLRPYRPLVARLFSALNEYVTRGRLGRVLNGVDVVLDRRADLVLTPDITFIVEGARIDCEGAHLGAARHGARRHLSAHSFGPAGSASRGSPAQVFRSSGWFSPIAASWSFSTWRMAVCVGARFWATERR